MTLPTVCLAMIGKRYKGHIIIAINRSVGGRFEIVLDDQSSIAIRDINWFYHTRILTHQPEVNNATATV